jgi:hypothetical protein
VNNTLLSRQIQAKSDTHRHVFALKHQGSDRLLFSIDRILTLIYLTTVKPVAANLGSATVGGCLLDDDKVFRGMAPIEGPKGFCGGFKTIWGKITG